MKKTIALLLVLVMLFALVSCGTTTKETVVTEERTVTEDVSPTEEETKETIRKDSAEPSFDEKQISEQVVEETGQSDNNEIAVGTWESFCMKAEGYSDTVPFYGISLTVNEDATYVMEFNNQRAKGTITDVKSVTYEGKVVERLYTLDDVFLLGVVIEKTGDEQIDGEANLLLPDGTLYGMNRTN
ncbi:MAG: hypothetical protein IJS31_04585 [Oscillospiraceae bacterium]|nr:hypothetical protein [Oscillospiraceae bacterium]